MRACSFMWQTFVGFMVDMFRERERERKRIGKRLRAWGNIHEEAKISDLQIFVTLFKSVPLLHLLSATPSIYHLNSYFYLSSQICNLSNKQLDDKNKRATGL